jgi:enamine deaminase RidA (YjgF/YER057c/UK114 family)
MANLEYSSYDGYGDFAGEYYWYSQAVRVGDRIECSGQGTLDPVYPRRVPRPKIRFDKESGGWDAKVPPYGVPKDVKDEVLNAFSNVELALKTAGGKGWSQVYKVTLYIVDMEQEILEQSLKELRVRCPVCSFASSASCRFGSD